MDLKFAHRCAKCKLKIRWNWRGKSWLFLFPQSLETRLIDGSSQKCTLSQRVHNAALQNWLRGLHHGSIANKGEYEPYIRT